MDSALRPRDIQARIRAGESVEDVAPVESGHQCGAEDAHEQGYQGEYEGFFEAFMAWRAGVREGWGLE